MQVKDGAAWAAMEYTKWLRDNTDKGLPDVTIIPAAIVYTNKSKYRSSVSAFPASLKVVFSNCISNRWSWSVSFLS